MTAESLAEVPEFPMAREARCPFDPPRACTPSARRAR